MQWLEIMLRVPREQGETVADILQPYGGVSITHEGIPPDRFDDDEIPPAPFLSVRVYLYNDDRVPAVKAEVEAALSAFDLTPVYTLVDDEDWADAWKKHYHPTRIGRHIIIEPVWEPATDTTPDDLIISLDPGMAFGTGTHPTTQLCLASLEALMSPGLSVLDLGCGSGILSIAAVKLGAAKVLAVDIDPVAIAATIENSTKNGTMDKTTAVEGGLESIVTSARRFDLMVANILARTLIEMCDQHLGEVVRPGGKAIFSGILATQVPDMEVAFKKAGLTITNVRQSDIWVSIETVR